MSKHRKHINRNAAQKPFNWEANEPISASTIEFYGKKWELIPEPNPRDFEEHWEVQDLSSFENLPNSQWVDGAVMELLKNRLKDATKSENSESAKRWNETVSGLIQSKLKDRHPVTLEKLDYE